MKLLVLRIFSHSERYDKMKEIHCKNGDKSIYAIYNPDLESEYRYTEKDQLLEIKGHETYIPGILMKTLQAVDICLKLFDFDVLVRSNVSTIINSDVLEEKLSKYDISGMFYAGTKITITEKNPIYGITDNNFHIYNGFEMAPGTSIILSNELCKHLVLNANKLDYKLIDDVSIATYIKSLDITFNLDMERHKILFDLKRLTREQLINGTKTALLYPFHRFRTDNDYDITNMELYYKTRDLILTSNNCVDL